MLSRACTLSKEQHSCRVFSLSTSETGGALAGARSFTESLIEMLAVSPAGRLLSSLAGAQCCNLTTAAVREGVEGIAEGFQLSHEKLTRFR